MMVIIHVLTMTVQCNADSSEKNFSNTHGFTNKDAYGKKLSEMVLIAENDDIFTSVAGIDLGLEHKIIESVLRTIECNYSNIRNPRNFMYIINDEFDFIVMSTAFNVASILEII